MSWGDILKQEYVWIVWGEDSGIGGTPIEGIFKSEESAKKWVIETYNEEWLEEGLSYIEKQELRD
jgi:hypothetical protein